MAALALVLVPTLFVNALNNYAALQLLSDAEYLTAIETDQLHAQAMFYLELYDQGFDMNGIFFGLWLLPFGYLVFKSGSVYESSIIPKIIGVLLMIGCFGYLIDFIAFALYPGFDATISLLTGWGEFIVPFWLIFKGGKFPTKRQDETPA
jgi:hypothetical protein